MAGEDTLTLSNGTVDTMTIIPTNGKIQVNGNGLHKQPTTQQQTNNNGSLVPNGKELEIVAVDNDNLVSSLDEKTICFDTDFDDGDTCCGWGPIRPRWLQRFATKQMFLFTFCITWVSIVYMINDINNHILMINIRKKKLNYRYCRACTTRTSSR